MATYSYGALRVRVTADTSALAADIRKSATQAGQQAAKGITGQVTKGVGGLRGLLSGVGQAASVALTGAAAAAGGFGAAAFKTAARVGEMDATLRALAKANKLSYPQMQATVTAIRHQGIEAAVAQGTVAEFAKNQLDLSKSTDLARVAQDAAVVSGQNSTETLDQLIHGIVTQNSLVLRNAGIQVDATQAQDAYAKSVGKTRAALTPAEKSQALLNAVLQKGTSVAGAYEAAMKEPGKVLRSYPRVLDDIRVSVGQGLVQGFGPLVIKGYELAKALSAALAPGGKLAPVMKAIGDVATAVARPVGAVTDRLAAWVKNLDPGQVQRFADALRRWGPLAAAAAAGLSLLTAPRILSNLPFLGDAAGSIGLAFTKSLIPGITGGAGAMGGLLSPMGLVVAAFAALLAVSPEFRKAVAEAGRALAGALLPALTGAARAARPLLPALAELARVIGSALARVLTAVMPLVQELAGALAELLPALLPLLPPLVQLTVAVLRPLTAVLAAVAGWAGKMAGWLVPLAAAVLAGVAAWKAYRIALLAVQLGPTAVALKLVAAQQMAMAAASKVAAAAQWLLNAALNANPVGIVVVALAALTAGLVVAYQRSQTFRNVVAAAFGFVRGVFDTVVKAAQTLWRWITGGSPGLVPAFRLLASVVTAAVSAVRQSCTAAFGAVRAVVEAAWRAVTAGTVTAWTAVVSFLKVTIWENGIKKPVVAAAAWVRDKLSQAWTAIKDTAARIWNGIVSFLRDTIWENGIKKHALAGVTWVRDKLAGTWENIRAAASQAWGKIVDLLRVTIWENGIKKHALAGVTWVRDKLSEAWENIRARAAEAWGKIASAIGAAFEKVKQAVGTPVWYVADKILRPIIGGINKLLGAIHIPTIDDKWINAIPHFEGKEHGGRIGRGWGGGDTVPILAEPGEWVLTKRQARAIGYGTLRSLPRYSEGGPVGPQPRLPGIGDIAGTVGGAIASGAKSLAGLGKDLLDDFTGMLRWVAAEAFEALTKPLRALADPWASDPNLVKQWIGKTVQNAIDAAVAFIKGKSTTEILGGAGGDMIALATSFNGHRYVWGGGANPQTGFDCSSFVSYVAGSSGLPLPGGFKAPSQAHGPVTGDYLRWGGMTTIPWAQIGPGDVGVNARHIILATGTGGKGFAARSTASGIGPQTISPGAYTVRRWNNVAAAGGYEKMFAVGAAGKPLVPGGGNAGLPFGGTIENLVTIARMLMQAGYSKNAAAGIAGNIGRESGGNPLIAGTGGRGLIGWTPPSTLPDSAFIPGNFTVSLVRQVEQIVRVYNQIWRAYIPRLNAAATAAEAAQVYCTYFERAGIPAMGERIRWANMVVTRLAGGGVIREPVTGVGHRTGRVYQLAEHAPEVVTPLAGGGRDLDGLGAAARRPATVINVYPRAGQSEDQIAAAVSRRLAWAQAGGQA